MLQLNSLPPSGKFGIADYCVCASMRKLLFYIILYYIILYYIILYYIPLACVSVLYGGGCVAVPER